jgi:hypothetical protein
LNRNESERRDLSLCPLALQNFADVAQLVEQSFQSATTSNLDTGRKSCILDLCQCLKSPEKNVFFVVKKHHGRDINIAAMHAKLNINISLISENGRPEK